MGESCRVHLDRDEFCRELCRACYDRLFNLQHRGRSAGHVRPFTLLQRETLLGLGRPSRGMRRAWPDLDEWVRRARAEVRSKVPPTPMGRPCGTADGGFCTNEIHNDERSPPLAGPHGLCRRCRERLQGLRFHRTESRRSIAVQTLLGLTPASLDSIAQSWTYGQWYRRHLAAVRGDR